MFERKTEQGRKINSREISTTREEKMSGTNLVEN